MISGLAGSFHHVHEQAALIESAKAYSTPSLGEGFLIKEGNIHIFATRVKNE
uniref:Uncharacterized protein n=1 Tax=Anguilla anguilla TaxID=7936 RepID=A0A0E9SDU0_ANGAN